jgi:transcriptional regulator with XRE-family HTH domain
MADLGSKLKNIREQNSFSQREVADHLGVTVQAVSQWEAGKSARLYGFVWAHMA